TCKPCSGAWSTPTKPRREAVRPGWHYPVGTGHAREVQPHQRASPVRGHGPLLPSQGGKLSALAGTILWERAMPVKCNHTSVQTVFVVWPSPTGGCCAPAAYAARPC